MKKIKNQEQKYKMLSEHTLEDYLKWCCGTENSRDHLASQNILKEGRKSLGELALAKSEA